METIIVKNHDENDRVYELHMNELPKNPEEYFNTTILGGGENWAWTGPGTAERNNYPTKEWAQVMD